ncbi:cytochrome c oxidase subunit VIb [Apiospora arundinis]|uniref:Cytochrome c oxidase subunit VIb n=1 Tax=Apiospora arundinis TaxID=335852 RepID=A0ABR2IAJ9_9PEZI
MSDDERETKPFKFVTAGKNLLPSTPPYPTDQPDVTVTPSPQCTSVIERSTILHIALSRHGIQCVDARFPNVNQTKHCWQNYVDYHKCINAKGEDFKPCRQFFLAYRSLCPSGWYQRWDEQRESGNFPAKLDV